MSYISWTKSWSSSDNGTILGGADLQNLQSDIVTVVNGGITNTNIASNAAIDESKLAFSATVGHIHDGVNSMLIPGVEIILSSTVVSFGANGDTTLFTVPAGKRCILTRAIVVAGASAGGTTLSIGASGSTTDFVPANTLSNLAAQYDVAILVPIPNTTPLKNKSYATGTVIAGTVGAHAGGVSNTVILVGILY